MVDCIIFVFGFEIRVILLINVGVSFEIIKFNVDEDLMKVSFIVEGVLICDIVDVLVEMKFLWVSFK